MCDGLSDCRDESDENYDVCGTNRTQSEAVSQLFLPPGVCGTSSTSFISYGKKTKLYQYPWTAVILHTYGIKFICIRFCFDFMNI